LQSVSLLLRSEKRLAWVFMAIVRGARKVATALPAQYWPDVDAV